MTSEAKVCHSPSAVLGTLHLLGGYSMHDGGRNLKTEHLVKDKWTAGFQLGSNMVDGCAVVSAPDEVITIAGTGEPNNINIMYHYNMTSGDATRLPAVPPTQANFLTTYQHSSEMKNTTII